MFFRKDIGQYSPILGMMRNTLVHSHIVIHCTVDEDFPVIIPKMFKNLFFQIPGQLAVSVRQCTLLPQIREISSGHIIIIEHDLGIGRRPFPGRTVISRPSGGITELPVSIIAVYKTILIHDGGIKIKQLDDAVLVLKGSSQVTETQIVLFQAEQSMQRIIRNPYIRFLRIKRHQCYGNSVF